MPGMLLWPLALLTGIVAFSLPAPALAADAATAQALAEAMHREKVQLGWQLSIASAGLLIALVAWRGARSQAGRAQGRPNLPRTLALCLIALAAFASYYDFFRAKPGVGFKDTDVFHYYMGSKYFSEVGYFDLYHCTLMALIESGVESRFELPRVRDQRTLRFHTSDSALAAARQCRAGFEDARWRAFAHDVAWFNHRFVPKHWRLVFEDHGYNPTPVWSAVGGAFSSRVPVDGAVFAALIDLDRWLIVLGLLAVGWAFGIEAAAVATIVWGTGTHWGFGWIGDSLLRNLWLFGVLLGLCLAKKRWDTLAGGFLALASLLRIFPGVFAAAFVAGAWLRGEQDAGERRRLVGFLTGAGATALFLLVWAATSTAWGIAAFAEFYEKMSVFAAQQSLNKLGLSSLVWRSIMVSSGHLTTNAEGAAILSAWSPAWLPFAIRGVQLAVLIPASIWFVRAARRLEAHESAALGFALIPLLADPANYYFSFAVCGALLAASRPVLRVGLLAVSVAWIANALWFYREPAEYLGASMLAVALSLFFLRVLSREEPALR